LAQEGKKSIDANYLFSDLIKVYEVNNESSQDLKTFSSDIPQEIFSDDEKIINLTANDFASVDNLIQQILTNDANIDVSKTDYNFPEAEITKEKFIVDKEKLLSILAIFFQNQNIKSTDLVKEKIENEDNLSITFKNKLDKISVSISPIKVEPQIDSEKKPNDFLFVNKILVDSLLPETQNEQSSDGMIRKLDVEKSVEKKEEPIDLINDEIEEKNIVNQSTHGENDSLTKNTFINVDKNPLEFAKNLVNAIDEPIDSKLIQTGSDEHITNTFYKVELIKIYDKQKYIPSIDSNDADSFLQKELNFKFVDEVVTKPIKDSSKIELNNSDNLKQEEVIIQKTNNESLENVSESYNSLSLKDIYDDLTDEEKSVFRKFEESNEIKKVVYSSNKIEKEKVADFVKTKTITENKDATQGIEIPKAETKVAFDKKPTINSEQKVATEEIQEFDEVNDNLKLKVENQNGKGNKLDDVSLPTDEKINSDKVEIKVNLSQSKQQTDKIDQEKPKIESVQLKNNVAEEKDNNAKPSVTAKENNSVTKEQTSKENNSGNQFEELTSVSEKVFVKVSSSPNIKVLKSIETETNNQNNTTNDFEVKENHSDKINQHKAEVETNIADETNPSIKAESKQAENSSNEKKVTINSEQKVATEEIQEFDEVNYNQKLKVENQNGKGNKLDGINLSTDEKINSDKVEIKVNFSQSKQQTDKIDQEKPKIETVQLKNNFVEEKDNNAKPSITSKENNSITKEQTSKENNSVNQFEELTSVSEKVLVKVSSSPNIKVLKIIETETNNQNNTTNDFEVKENHSDKINQHKAEVETIIANENNPSIKVESKQAENSSIDKKVEIKTAESKIQVADEKQNSTSDKHYSENKNNFESSKNNFAKNDFSQLNISGNMDFEKLKLPVEQKSFFESTKPLTQNEIIPEFSKFIQLGEKQSISFQLTPENLGKVNLIVDLVDNVVTTKIEVENEQVKQFIQSNLDQLKNNLQSNGIQLSNINISLADYSQKQNGKIVAEKKKYNSKISREEEKVEEVNLHKATKKMGYNTYEFLA